MTGSWLRRTTLCQGDSQRRDGKKITVVTGLTNIGNTNDQTHSNIMGRVSQELDRIAALPTDQQEKAKLKLINTSSPDQKQDLLNGLKRRTGAGLLRSRNIMMGWT
jgi:hypothetical protein